MTILPVTFGKINKMLQAAAKLIALNIKILKEIHAKGVTSDRSWPQQKVRNDTIIFITNDVVPQEAPDCLDEKFTQVFG